MRSRQVSWARRGDRRRWMGKLNSTERRSLCEHCVTYLQGRKHNSETLQNWKPVHGQTIDIMDA